MEVIFYNFILFMLGACLSSFGSCVGYRIPRGMNWISGHSQCNVCGKPLTFKELIPVFSCLFLSARCSKCRAYFGWRNCICESLFGGACVIFTILDRDMETRALHIGIICVICVVLSAAQEMFLYYLKGK